MLDVSDDFTEAEGADVNRPIAEVSLILGNYATAAFGSSASASGAAANYPASGAIDGDRTEINAGAASAADNDVGQSTWRSTVAPDTTPQTLTIDMAQSRTINRIKLYHMASHAISSYKLESSPDNSAWTLIAKTTTQAGTITTTQEVDTIDFDDVDCRYVRLTVTNTVVAADMANVVELEIYRLLDVTDRVMSVKTSRARDYQLSNSLAATASVVLSNSDRFFSPSYAATDAEDDFVNAQLKPGIGVSIRYGFSISGADELAQNFIGTIDKFTIKPGTRTATIDARDNMKPTFNQIISTKLKTNSDIGTLIQYLLNQVNISTWESDIDQTGINIDYFFTFDQTIIESIRSLVEGAGDADFYIDENGIATFRSYLDSTALQHLDTTEADFEAGTRTDIDTTTVPGKLTLKWFKLESWDDGDFTSNPAWEASYDHAAGVWTITDGVISAVQSGASNKSWLTTPFSGASGTWEARIKVTDDAGQRPIASFFFVSNGVISDGVGLGAITNSYSVEIRDGSVLLVRWVGNTPTTLGTYVAASDLLFHLYRVTKTTAGVISLYIDGVVRIVATDTTYTTSAKIGLLVASSVGVGRAYFDDIYWSPVVEATEAVATEGVYVSQTIDQSALVNSEGIFQATKIELPNTTLTWYTATSDDGVTWDAYVAVTPGGAIASTLRRYIRYKIVFDSTAYLLTPTVTDVTVNWTVGGGSSKFPSSISFVFDETLNMDLDQIYADTVAGGSAIINSIGVKAQPLVLTGANTDVTWQGTTGVPPVPVSVTDPVGVTNGQTLTYSIVVQGGMDISRMSGANPAAAAITFAGGGAGSWVFSSIHPTRPVLVITITGTGTITNLQVQGKVFSSDDTFLDAVADDTDSIKEFGERRTQISNQFIVNSAAAQAIADRLIENLADPITYTPQVKVRPTFSIQVGDRVTLEDSNLGISEDSIVIGVEHFISSSLTSGEAYTVLKLLKIST